MIRAQVLMSLYLLCGMLFIVDLYIGSVYLNEYVRSTQIKSVLEDQKRLSVPGLDMDFGFDRDTAPSDATIFPYHLNVRQGKFRLAAPRTIIAKAGSTTPLLLEYAANKIMTYHAYLQKNHQEDEFQEHGIIWVSDEIIKQMKEGLNGGNGISIASDVEPIFIQVKTVMKGQGHGYEGGNTIYKNKRKRDLPQSIEWKESSSNEKYTIYDRYTSTMYGWRNIGGKKENPDPSLSPSILSQSQYLPLDALLSQFETGITGQFSHD